MYRGARIAVVIPAYNEERLIALAITRVPAFVDHIIVVDDCSPDRTSVVAGQVKRPGVEVIRNERNQGVGGAIVVGYRRARELAADVVAVMAGDAQMDPEDLSSLLDPVVADHVDYAKGNRFAHADCRRVMPGVRYVGNRALSALTRWVTGYRRVADAQCGYTAIHRRCLETLELGRLWPRYGFPNDLLAHLSVWGYRVADVPVRPIYGEETSGIRPILAVFSLSFVLARAWLYRAPRLHRRRLLPTSLQPGGTRP